MTDIAVLRLPHYLAGNWQRTFALVLPNIERSREIFLGSC